MPIQDDNKLNFSSSESNNMSHATTISVPFSTFLHLEGLNYDLQTHYYALKVLTDNYDQNWSDHRARLLLERVNALAKTVVAFHEIESSLRL